MVGVVRHAGQISLCCRKNTFVKKTLADIGSSVYVDCLLYICFIMHNYYKKETHKNIASIHAKETFFVFYVMKINRICVVIYLEKFYLMFYKALSQQMVDFDEK